MSPDHYQNVIIGSGEGGKFLAWHLAQSGERTVVIERRWVGGSCPNINCLPSKNEIWSAKAATLIRHADEFGIKTGSVSIDMAAVQRRKREMVDGLIATHQERYKTSGAELVMGSATVTGSRTVEVKLNEGGRRSITGERIFLNLGTHASIPSIPGLVESEPLTSIEALNLERLPEHLLVIGGGYVGLEFAQAYRRFGSQVTILQHGAQLLSNQDIDVAAEIMHLLSAEGIDVIAPTDIQRVEGRSGASVTITVRTPSNEKTILGSDILVAAGRTPNTAGMGLPSAGVELNAQGYIKVNERLETTSPGIWAIGECAGSPQFTHASFDDFRIIRDNLAGANRTTRDRVIPSCLFTDPPLAHIGLTENDARHRAISVRVLKLPISAVLRTRTTGETRGFMKALLSADDDRILGFTMIGAEAGEVMAVVQTAMLADLPYITLRDAIFTHPTMAEGLNLLFSQIPTMGADAQPAALSGKMT